jgi:hypothetical protein
MNLKMAAWFFCQASVPDRGWQFEGHDGHAEVGTGPAPQAAGGGVADPSRVPVGRRHFPRQRVFTFRPAVMYDASCSLTGKHYTGVVRNSRFVSEIVSQMKNHRS